MASPKMEEPLDHYRYTPIAALPEAGPYGVDVLDVDADHAAKVRYGHKIPVLLFAGELVCHGHLDPEELHKALAYHRRPV